MISFIRHFKVKGNEFVAFKPVFQLDSYSLLSCHRLPKGPIICTFSSSYFYFRCLLENQKTQYFLIPYCCNTSFQPLCPTSSVLVLSSLRPPKSQLVTSQLYTSPGGTVLYQRSLTRITHFSSLIWHSKHYS